MQESNIKNISEQLLDKIISVAYGDAGLFDKITVWIKAKTDPEVKNLLNEYSVTAESIHRLSQEDLPAEIENAIRKKVGVTNNREKPQSQLSYAFISFFAKPAYPAAAIGLIVAVIISFMLFKQPAASHTYTKAEIELAQKQLEKSFAIIGKVFEDTEKQLDDEVLSKRVSKPLSKELKFLNDYFIGG